MPLIARSHLKRLGKSAMEPQIFVCAVDDPPDAAGEWVLKLMGRGNSELIGDWVGCLLAKALNLPTPVVDIADVSAEAIATCPDDVQSWALPGPAFASGYLSDTQGIPSDRAAVDLCSSEFLGSLYAVDTWLEVLDRKKPEGTWNLLRRNAEDDSNAYVIDFGKCMAECLFPPVLAPGTMFPPAYPPLVRQAASLDAALATSLAIERVADDFVDEVVGSIPSAWLADDQLRGKIASFLTTRRTRVSEACGKLKEGLP